MSRRIFETVSRLEGKLWTFAKTMPTNPHWYTLRKHWPDESRFEDAVIVIREFGREEWFKGYPYVVFYANGFRYWSMGYPVRETTVINRTAARYESSYDVIAPSYDEMFADAEAKDEDRRLMEILPWGASVLDVGCGTGLVLEHKRPSDRYLGIDPSRKMLAELVRKHPGTQLVNVNFEDFYGAGFDTILSLYGAASHVDPSAWSKIPAMLAPGGKAALMFYRPGYHPLTFRRSGSQIDHFDFIPTAEDCVLSSVVEPFGDYVIWRIG